MLQIISMTSTEILCGFRPKKWSYELTRTKNPQLTSKNYLTPLSSKMNELLVCLTPFCRVSDPLQIQSTWIQCIIKPSS